MKKFEYKRIYREVGYRELDMIGEAGVGTSGCRAIQD